MDYVVVSGKWLSELKSAFVDGRNLNIETRSQTEGGDKYFV